MFHNFHRKMYSARYTLYCTCTICVCLRMQVVFICAVIFFHVIYACMHWVDCCTLHLVQQFLQQHKKHCTNWRETYKPVNNPNLNTTQSYLLRFNSCDLWFCCDFIKVLEGFGSNLIDKVPASQSYHLIKSVR